MEIIPVIDLMGGIVVHAKAGTRHQYQPLKSTVTHSTEPLQVIEDLLSYHSFTTVYIADLDAIMQGINNRALYKRVVEEFPAITVWLDSGIEKQDQKNALRDIPRLIPIVASETWSDKQSPVWNKSDVLSLDFKQGDIIGDDLFLKQYGEWPETVIAMNLDCIGIDLGPDIALLQTLKSKRSDIRFIAAGGVRNDRDLCMLKREGVSAALVASALHSGALDKVELKKYS